MNNDTKLFGINCFNEFFSFSDFLAYTKKYFANNYYEELKLFQASLSVKQLKQTLLQTINKNCKLKFNDLELLNVDTNESEFKNTLNQTKILYIANFDPKF
jgi:hypothetical protein